MEQKKYKEIARGDIFWLNKSLSLNLGKNVQFLDRPYVVISNNINNSNDKSPIVNMAFLTKQTGKANYPMHVFLNAEKYGLEYDSVICTEQVITVNKIELKDKIATLDNDDLNKLNKAIVVQYINEKGILNI